VTPKERRDRLFKKSRPYIRPFEVTDMGWLWAAYKAGSFQFPPDLSQEDFVEHMHAALNGATHYLVEDENRKFHSKHGPVGLVGVVSSGEKIEPAVAVFKWATPKNVLRGFVAFFQWIKSSSEVGECVVRASAKDKLMKKVVDYGVLYPRTMETVYGVRGKRK
jgi:hypothetical protein